MLTMADFLPTFDRVNYPVTLREVHTVRKAYGCKFL